MSKQVTDALRLLIITVAAGAVLGYMYDITKEPIAAQEQLKTEQANKAVLADADTFESIDSPEYAEDAVENTFVSVLESDGYTNDTINNVVVGIKDNAAIGYVFTVTSHDGYSGDIKYSVGVDNDGTVMGISLLSISETPGLGMKAKEDPTFLEQYNDVMTDKFSVVKDGSGNSGKDADKGSNIDAITGSTITSKSITGGVNSALSAFRALDASEGLKTTGGVTLE